MGGPLINRPSRALALLAAASTLALLGTIVTTSPIRTQAVGAAASLDSARSWGSNVFGQLGNGTTTSSSTPVQVALAATDTLAAIAAGGDDSLALTTTGQLLAWGSNSNGQLGNGTTTSSSTPVQVSLPPGTTITAIAEGGQYALAVTSSGQVLAWGRNTNGQLGNGTTTDSSTPVAVSLPSGTTVTAIAAGSRHALALTSTGQVLAWGYNSAGQLGNGTTTSSSTPVQVSLPSGTSVTTIAGGGSHSLALASSGTVLAWGDNSSGQLGNGTTTSSSTAVQVSVPSGTTVTAISAGNSHSLALTANDQILAWGNNAYGQLGNGTTTNTSTPAPVNLPAGTPATAIAAGALHNLALTSSGQVLAWGENLYGELGNGSTANSSTPVAVSNLQTVVTAIAAGNYHSLAIQLPKPVGSPAGAAWAWGSNLYGTLGNGTTITSRTPVKASLPAGTTITSIAGGDFHTLAVTSDGKALAWGLNGNGQLGDGTTTDSSVPVQVALPSGTIVTAVAGGDHHSLALTSSGQVLSWGSNSNGQLGNGTTTDSSIPVLVSLPAGTIVKAIAAGFGHSLALTSFGHVYAWGWNSYGQLGNGSLIDSSTPFLVGAVGTYVFRAIAAGDYHSMASDGQTIFSWGQNTYGQLGNGTTTNNSNPVRVSLAAGTTITALAGGQDHSLALTTTGSVLSWGRNLNGQLGNGTTVDSSTPVNVTQPAGTIATAISAGFTHSLALTSTGQVLAWGNNASAQLGNGAIGGASSTPVAVIGLETVVTAIACGGNHSLAIEPPAAAALPAMTNKAYGGYLTAVTIQNTGNAPAVIRIAYFNQAGGPVGAGDSNDNLPVNASWTVRQDNGNSFPGSGGDAAQAGSAIVYSSEPIATFVNEFSPGNVGDATSYSGVQVPSGVGATLYAPTIVNNAYGGYTTGIGLLNQGRSPTDVTITYRNGSGGVVRTQAVSGLAAHAYKALYSGDAVLALPSGFAGTATITSSTGQPLGAIVNETGPGGQFSSYDAAASGSTLLNAPVALNNAYGGYYTGMGIQNTSASPDTVSVTYYDALGTPTAPKNFTILGYGSLGVYQGSATDGPAAGAYTAVIQSTAVPLAAIVNEVAPAGAGAARQSTSYNTFSVGSANLHLPLVENAGSDPWNTGEGIMNTGTSSTTVQVSYYDTATGAAVGTAQGQSLAPHAFWGLYQPVSGLPSGTRATAVVTTSSGGQVAVICNESSPTTFMSYDGQ